MQKKKGICIRGFQMYFFTPTKNPLFFTLNKGSIEKL